MVCMGRGPCSGDIGGIGRSSEGKRVAVFVLNDADLGDACVEGDYVLVRSGNDLLYKPVRRGEENLLVFSNGKAIKSQENYGIGIPEELFITDYIFDHTLTPSADTMERKIRAALADCYDKKSQQGRPLIAGIADNLYGGALCIHNGRSLESACFVYDSIGPGSVKAVRTDGLFTDLGIEGERAGEIAGSLFNESKACLPAVYAAAVWDDRDRYGWELAVRKRE
jgi:hypothetical protein